jgi:hypothetical protein
MIIPAVGRQWFIDVVDCLLFPPPTPDGPPVCHWCINANAYKQKGGRKTINRTARKFACSDCFLVLAGGRTNEACTNSMSTAREWANINLSCGLLRTYTATFSITTHKKEEDPTRTHMYSTRRYSSRRLGKARQRSITDAWITNATSATLLSALPTPSWRKSGEWDIRTGPVEPFTQRHNP